MLGERGKVWLTTALILVAVGIVGIVIRNALAPHHFSESGDRGQSALPFGVGVRLNRPEFIGFDVQTRKEWIVRADVVDISVDKSRIDARGNVEAELLDPKSGKQRAIITAPRAIFTRQSKTLQVSNQLLCRAFGDQPNQEFRISTDTLIWNIGAKQIFCPGSVAAQLPDGVSRARGSGLTLDLETRVWTLNQFHGNFVAPEGQGNAPPPIPNPLKSLFGK